MLTKISAVTAAITAVLNAVVLVGIWDLTADQITGVSIAILAVGSAVHAWVNPDVPIGNTDK